MPKRPHTSQALLRNYAYECLLLPLALLPLARHHGLIILLGGLPEGLLKKMRAFVRPAIHQHDLRRKLLEV